MAGEETERERENATLLVPLLLPLHNLYHKDYGCMVIHNACESRVYFEIIMGHRVEENTRLAPWRPDRWKEGTGEAAAGQSGRTADPAVKSEAQLYKSSPDADVCTGRGCFFLE